MAKISEIDLKGKFRAKLTETLAEKLKGQFHFDIFEKVITQCGSRRSWVLRGSRMTFGNFAQKGSSRVSNLRYHTWHPTLLPLHQSNDPVSVRYVDEKFHLRQSKFHNYVMTVQFVNWDYDNRNRVLREHLDP